MEDYEKMASDVGILSCVSLGICFEEIHVVAWLSNILKTQQALFI